MSIKFKLTNNINKVIKQLQNNEIDTLEAIGSFCKGKMDIYVAVDTGELKSNNTYKVVNKMLSLENKTPYAGFQEYGTSRQAGTPFMRPAVYKHLSEIEKIAAANMSKGLK